MYNDCDINARCLMNDNRTKYQCVCNPGYDGDGKVCISRGRVNKTNVLIQVTVYQVFFYTSANKLWRYTGFKVLSVCRHIFSGTELFCLNA